MKEQIHKYNGDYVILRFDENEKDWRKNWRTEYWTWNWRKPWPKNAKVFWHEDDAAQELVMIRVRKATLSTK